MFVFLVSVGMRFIDLINTLFNASIFNIQQLLN